MKKSIKKMEVSKKATFPSMMFGLILVFGLVSNGVGKIDALSSQQLNCWENTVSDHVDTAGLPFGKGVIGISVSPHPVVRNKSNERCYKDAYWSELTDTIINKYSN